MSWTIVLCKTSKAVYRVGIQDVGTLSSMLLTIVFFYSYMIGFSFGGLLASAIAASVWDAPFISSDILKENMTCITFGQPHVKIEVIQSVAKRKPEMISTFHSVYLEDDHIPSVLSLLDDCWSAKLQKQLSEGTVGMQLPLAVDTNAVSFWIDNYVQMLNLPCY